jgi:hypothetical protein
MTWTAVFYQIFALLFTLQVDIPLGDDAQNTTTADSNIDLLFDAGRFRNLTKKLMKCTFNVKYRSRFNHRSL